MAEILQINTQAVYTLMKKERWPHSKYGTRIRFEPSDVENIRAMHRVDVGLKARPTHIGTELARRRAHAYNVRNGLVEQRYTGPIPPNQ
ncbi:hypothetical protein [Pseudarthrobacter sp. LT1]|uniref:hypothetical protein n=1 Tax=Pseudarthrobacter sp. LT1 TaxID=3111450 RepID=UPI003B635CC7